jgi:hypothetical protein
VSSGVRFCASFFFPSQNKMFFNRAVGSKYVVTTFQRLRPPVLKLRTSKSHCYSAASASPSPVCSSASSIQMLASWFELISKIPHHVLKRRRKELFYVLASVSRLLIPFFTFLSLPGEQKTEGTLVTYMCLWNLDAKHSSYYKKPLAWRAGVPVMVDHANAVHSS